MHKYKTYVDNSETNTKPKQFVNYKGNKLYSYNHYKLYNNKCVLIYKLMT